MCILALQIELNQHPCRQTLPSIKIARIGKVSFSSARSISGDDRNRTGNLLVANQALYGDEKRCRTLLQFGFLLCTHDADVFRELSGFCGNYRELAPNSPPRQSITRSCDGGSALSHVTLTEFGMVSLRQESFGKEDETRTLKPLAETLRVRIPPGKAGHEQPEASWRSSSGWRRIGDPAAGRVVLQSMLPITCRQAAPNLWNEFGRDGHRRGVLGFPRRLDVGKLLILGLTFVMCDQLLHTLFVRARGGNFCFFISASSVVDDGRLFWPWHSVHMLQSRIRYQDLVRHVMDCCDHRRRIWPL